MQHVTLVRKILSNGRSCERCSEINQQLRSDGLMHHINHLVVADDRDADSMGLRLARQFAIKQVPFFLVEDEQGKTHIFQDYQEFKQFIQ